MTLAYDLVKAPVNLAFKAVDLLSLPIHVANTLAVNTAETAFKIAGVNTEDAPLESLEGKESIYDVANDNLNISALIYYYAELRAEAKQLFVALALKKNLSTESSPGEPSQLFVLHDAIEYRLKMQEQIKAGNTPEPTENRDMLKEYQSSVTQLDDLCESYGIDQGELAIFTTYQNIVRNNKNLENIKGDLVRYDHLIDPQFRVGFGGSEFNRENVDQLIEGGKDIYIHYMDDVFNSSSFDLHGLTQGIKSEIVWAIVVNKTDKKISVVFRGSVNLQDFVTDASFAMKDCNLPGYVSASNKDDKQGFGKVHRGFYNSLFEKTKVGPNGSDKSKGEEIIGMLRTDFFDKDEYQGYSFIVTGHSLGASLSTLFAFRCACLDEPLPNVLNVSFASPFVGNDEFRKHFQALEMKGKIRHLRVSNYQDIVPLGLPCSPTGEGYKHVGMNIRLYSGDDLLSPNYRRFYPKLGSFLDGARNTMQNSWSLLPVIFLPKHFCDEYDIRLNNKETKKELSKLTLESLYNDKSITGWP